MNLENNVEPNEIHEEAITKMRKWLSSIYPESKIDRALWTEKAENQELHLIAKIWTDTNNHTITGIVGQTKTYLGGSASSRKPRTGETWTRGNDLVDGPFSEETWNKIMADIIRYECQEIKSERWKDKYKKHGA